MNIIYPQTGFFVKRTNVSLRGLEYSSNLLPGVSFSIFRNSSWLFRNFDGLTKKENPASYVRCDQFPCRTHGRIEMRTSIASPSSFAVFNPNRGNRTRRKLANSWVYAISVAFILRPTELFEKAGCAEPRCDDFKEGLSKFQGDTSFSLRKGRPGSQISFRLCFFTVIPRKVLWKLDWRPAPE